MRGGKSCIITIVTLRLWKKSVNMKLAGPKCSTICSPVGSMSSTMLCPDISSGWTVMAIMWWSRRRKVRVRQKPGSFNCYRYINIFFKWSKKEWRVYLYVD